MTYYLFSSQGIIHFINKYIIIFAFKFTEHESNGDLIKYFYVTCTEFSYLKPITNIFHIHYAPFTRFLRNRINHTRTELNFRTSVKHNFRFAKTRQRGFNLRHDFRKTRRRISDVNGYINRGRRSAYTLRQRNCLRSRY